jgi:hypothetical protein
MAATSLSSKKSEEFIRALQKQYPQFKFKPASRAHWSPRSKTINYCNQESFSKQACSTLHELAHAILGHSNYASDFELLKMEADAWQLASQLGKDLDVKISDEYIQNCLDTYRDWLHRRSTCPTCGVHVMQSDVEHYQCYNCQTIWHVTSARFLRPYRKTV